MHEACAKSRTVLKFVVFGNIDISGVIGGGIHFISLVLVLVLVLVSMSLVLVLVLVLVSMSLVLGIGVGIGIGIGVGIGIGIGIYSGVGIGKLDSCWSSGRCQVPAVVIGQRGQCGQL